MMHATLRPPVALPVLLAAVLPWLGATEGPAQQQPSFTVPSGGGVPFPNNNLPFAGAPMRYQQVYRAQAIASSVGPVRIKGIWFRGDANGQQGALVTMDLLIAHAARTVSAQFDANIGADPLQVLAQQQVQLPSPSAIDWILNFDFGGREFVWNGRDDILIDVRIRGNGNNNLPFAYHFTTVSAAPASVRRLFTAGNPNATVAQIDQNGVGLVTRFDYNMGVNLPFGSGCQGQGGFVPEAGASELPLVGSTTFRFQVTRARPQVAALNLLGTSNTTWGQISLPSDLGPIGATGCSLLVNPIILSTATTLGGSPGAGTASVPMPIPAVGEFVGANLYTQWLVADGSQNAAGFVMSNGLWTIIGI